MVEVGVLCYPGVQQAAVLGLTDLLCVAGRLALPDERTGASTLRVSHWRQLSEGAPPVRVFDSLPGSQARLAVMVLPPSLEPPMPRAAAQHFSGWLRECHGNGVVLASVCAGFFLLAETGLLDEREATTHWMFADIIRAHYPTVRLDIDKLIVDGADLITVGGAMAWVDLGLRLVDRFLGAPVMLETARRLVVDPPGREQRYYSPFSPSLAHGDAAVLKAQHWLHATDATDLALASLAACAGLEERTLLRRFQKATGMTTSEYGQRIRVGKAREMLQSTGLSVDRVAWAVGYCDTGAFRKVFSRIVGLTPGEYRKRFGCAG